jgi:hypothetical protein
MRALRPPTGATVPPHDVVVCSRTGSASVGAPGAGRIAGEALHAAARYANAACVAPPPEGCAGLGPEAAERLLAEV